MHPHTEDFCLATVLYALGDETRLHMVAKLAMRTDGAECQQLVVEGVPKSTQSNHFKILREAGVIHMEPAGRKILCTLRATDLARAFPGLLEAVLTNYHNAPNVPEDVKAYLIA